MPSKPIKYSSFVMTFNDKANQTGALVQAEIPNPNGDVKIHASIRMFDKKVGNHIEPWIAIENFRPARNLLLEMPLLHFFQVRKLYGIIGDK